MIAAQTRTVNITKKRNFGLSVKASFVTTTLGNGGITSRVNERRVRVNSTNDSRALQLWGELGKIAMPGKQYTKKKKEMGYNKAAERVQT